VHALVSRSGSPCGSSFVSVGLKYGGTAGDNYDWYMAGTNSAGQYFDILAPTFAANDGSLHNYRITYLGPYSPDGRGSFTTAVDEVGPPTAASWSRRWDYQGFGSCVSQVGVNSNLSPSASYRTGQYSASNLQWRSNVSGITRSGWDASQYWIESPCGTSPNCFNGLYYGSTRWDSNKP